MSNMSKKVLIQSLCAMALFWACASDSQSGGGGGGASPPRGSASPAAGSNAKPSTGSNAMSGITTAYTAFRAYAAQKLGIPADTVEGGPKVEALARMVKTRVGALWAFMMQKPGEPKSEIRGWAADDGTVVTLDQNLGRLFVEAGVWGGAGGGSGAAAPRLTDREIADRLVWSLGPKYTIYSALPHNIPAPMLTLKDGAGTFSFTVNHTESGPGGVGGGPPQLTRIDIALTADHRASATQKRIPSP